MRDEVGPYVNECRQFIAELAARLQISPDRSDLIVEGSTSDEKDD